MATVLLKDIRNLLDVGLSQGHGADVTEDEIFTVEHIVAERNCIVFHMSVELKVIGLVYGANVNRYCAIYFHNKFILQGSDTRYSQ